MTGIVILTAVELEAWGLARELELRPLPRAPYPCFEGTLAAGRLVVAPMGLGARFLPDRWPALAAEFSPDLVISGGTCGALDPSLNVGDLVLAREVLTPRGNSLPVSSGVVEVLARAATAAGSLARLGTLLCAEKVMTSPEAKSERWHATGAIAVDLESGPILEFARRRGLSAGVIRGVSDSADQPLAPELLDLVTPAGGLRPGRALGLALTRPRVLSQALALRRGASRAMRAVARLLGRLCMPASVHAPEVE
ncbi:MAG: hypothetical protein ACE5JD_02130 [Candidatus Methylomirabilia bacterium]